FAARADAAHGVPGSTRKGPQRLRGRSIDSAKLNRQFPGVFRITLYRLSLSWLKRNWTPLVSPRRAAERVDSLCCASRRNEVYWEVKSPRLDSAKTARSALTSAGGKLRMPPGSFLSRFIKCRSAERN